MNRLYNTQSHLASNLKNFFKTVAPNISKPHLKIIPYIILGMIESESVVTFVQRLMFLLKLIIMSILI